MAKQKVVLVTGVSSGSGQAAARLLTQKGFIVFGTSRQPGKAEPIPGADIIPLDLCSSDSIIKCIDSVYERTGQIDILVNNAGYELGGAVEEPAMEEIREQLETNFFGVIHMIKRVLPIMRRQGQGQIINVGSMAAVAPVPFLGYYSASKAAVSAYTEALRHEVKHLDIRVSLIEPQNIRSNLAINRQYTPNHIDAYTSKRRNFFEKMDRLAEDDSKASPPMAVAECVMQIIEDPAPKLRYRVGKDTKRITRSLRFLPEAMFERGTRNYFGLDDPDKKQAEEVPETTVKYP